MSTMSPEAEKRPTVDPLTVYKTESGSSAENAFSKLSNREIVDSVSDAERKRILRKIDFRVIPIVGLIYCISLLDRTNLGNAEVAGMGEELHLDQSSRYSIITLVFFITYVIFQPPATALIRKFGARSFLAVITLVWGVVMMCFGFVQSWEPLVALRLLLGILEAGCFPGIIYLMSTWYVRYDLGIRYGWWYTAGAFASAFGSILAFALVQMDGVAGYRGWRWIFIVEGLITILIGILGAIFLVSFPDDRKHKVAGFITERERQYIIASIEMDRGDAITEPFNLKKYLKPAGDWKIWCYGGILGASTTVGYALAYFLPIILNKGLGFGVAESQILVAPPYVYCAILMVIVTWLSDKYRQRGLFLALMAISSLIGMGLVGFVETVGVRYFGVFLAVSGAVINIPLISCWQANNIRGQWKRAFCSATLVGSGGIGGIIGSTVFRPQDEPHYTPGVIVTMGACGVVLILVVILEIAFYFENRKADRGEQVIEEGEADFRYTY